MGPILAIKDGQNITLYTGHSTGRPYERKTQKICENFALKVFDFLVFQLIAKKIYKTMTERKILYWKQKENFALKTEKKIVMCKILQKFLPKDNFLPNRRKKENFAEIWARVRERFILASDHH